MQTVKTDVLNVYCGCVRGREDELLVTALRDYLQEHPTHRIELMGRFAITDPRQGGFSGSGDVCSVLINYTESDQPLKQGLTILSYVGSPVDGLAEAANVHESVAMKASLEWWCQKYPTRRVATYVTSFDPGQLLLIYEEMEG